MKIDSRASTGFNVTYIKKVIKIKTKGKGCYFYSIKLILNNGKHFYISLSELNSNDKKKLETEFKRVIGMNFINKTGQFIC